MSDEGLNPQDVIELKNAVAGLAEIMREYFLRLREQGFSRREAMEILLDYQRGIGKGGSGD